MEGTAGWHGVNFVTFRRSGSLHDADPGFRSGLARRTAIGRSDHAARSQAALDRSRGGGRGARDRGRQLRTCETAAADGRHRAAGRVRERHCRAHSRRAGSQREGCRAGGRGRGRRNEHPVLDERDTLDQERAARSRRDAGRDRRRRRHRPRSRYSFRHRPFDRVRLHDGRRGGARSGRAAGRTRCRSGRAGVQPLRHHRLCRPRAGPTAGARGEVRTGR